MKSLSCKLAIFAGVMACMPLTVSAQAYPDRPVHVIIPHGPAGTNDIAGRIIFNKVAEQTGRQFVLENRPGAGSTIGEAAVASSAPDGYTIMVHSTTVIANAHLSRKLAYDPRTAFVPVSPLASQTGIIGVNPSVPANTIGELLELSKSKPGTINYASAGFGSYTHIVRRQGFWDNRRRELTEALVHQVCHIRPLHLDEASGAV